MESSCTVEQRPGATIVHVAGSLDAASAPELRQVFIDVLGATPSTHLVVNLSDVDFIDSTGIGVIVGARRRVIAKGGRLSAVVTTPAVRRALELTGMLQAWNVTDTVEEALG